MLMILMMLMMFMMLMMLMMLMILMILMILMMLMMLTSWEGPSRMGLVRILELGHFMLHLVVTHPEHFIKSNCFCSPSTIG